MHGVEVRAVAVRLHLKDVVCWLPRVDQWALVHLTGRVEQDAKWPSAFCTPEWTDVVAEFAED